MGEHINAMRFYELPIPIVLQMTEKGEIPESIPVEENNLELKFKNSLNGMPFLLKIDCTHYRHAICTALSLQK